MYCSNCGNHISNNANHCEYCGASTKGVQSSSNAYNPEHQTSKTIVGVILGLLLGLIGLVIGILMYPSNTVARRTFLKGWIIAFVISVIGSIILSVLYVAFMLIMLGGL